MHSPRSSCILLAVLAFVPIENAGHTAINNSPVTDSNVPCGYQMWFSFMHHPQEPIDTSCLSRLRNFAFEGNARVARLLGTADVWENPSVQ